MPNLVDTTLQILKIIEQQAHQNHKSTGDEFIPLSNEEIDNEIKEKADPFGMKSMIASLDLESLRPQLAELQENLISGLDDTQKRLYNNYLLVISAIDNSAKKRRKIIDSFSSDFSHTDYQQEDRLDEVFRQMDDNYELDSELKEDKRDVEFIFKENLNPEQQKVWEKICEIQDNIFVKETFNRDSERAKNVHSHDEEYNDDAANQDEGVSHHITISLKGLPHGPLLMPAIKLLGEKLAPHRFMGGGFEVSNPGIYKYRLLFDPAKDELQLARSGENETIDWDEIKENYRALRDHLADHTQWKKRPSSLGPKYEMSVKFNDEYEDNKLLKKALNEMFDIYS